MEELLINVITLEELDLTCSIHAKFTDVKAAGKNYVHFSLMKNQICVSGDSKQHKKSKVFTFGEKNPTFVWKKVKHFFSEQKKN